MSGRRKCICQICTCGRHLCVYRCKDSQLKIGDDSLNEANGELFEAGAKRKTRDWDLVNGETQNISAVVDQINAQQVLANASQATAVTVENKGNSQVYTTSNGNRWTERQVPKRQLIRPTDHLKTGGESNFTTGYQLDYTQKSSDLSTQAAGESTQAAGGPVEFQQDSWNQRQIPKTLSIKKPDSLTLSGPLSLETTNKSDFNENVFQSKAADAAQKETTHRPRTSLKLSGEFQSDSSYQRAFTPKRTEDVVKVKKGTVVSDSHLKPEGDMTFDTTSLDYEAAVSELSKWKSENDRSVPLKPKPVKPQSTLKIPQVPLEDETTLVTDYKRWNVGKPERHKPADTLNLGDGITDVDGSSPSTARQIYLETDAKINDARWHVSRPVVRKPQNNLKTEGGFNFATTNDIDYTSRRSRYSQSNLETVTERGEKETTERVPETETFSNEKQAILTERNDIANFAEKQQPDNLVETSTGVERKEVPEREIASRVPTPPQQTDISEQVAASNLENQYETQTNDADYVAQNGDQMEYVPWDLIRPKPIRPQSNLRQEGGMEFNTTNRSEFVQRSTERVKGIRPKTTTKIFDGDFDPTTMNQIMFSNNHAERVNPIRPKSNLHLEDGQFTDETTTAREYQQWEIKRPSPIVHKTNLTQEGSIDFTTTNRTEFEEKHPEKVYPIRPPTTKRLTGDLELTTTNQMMHGSFPIERVQKIVPQPNLRTSSGVFNSETTNKAQFQEYHIDRPKPIRPVPNLRQEGSMDFTTMNQLQFEEKPIEKVSQFRPHTSSKITGDFQGETTNSIMYAAQQGERPQMIKPRGNIELEKGIFASDTTNHMEFQQWQPAKPQAVTPRNNLQQEGDMDFTTTNQVQYAAKTGERVSQIRPRTNPKISGEFDGTTTNRIMYQNIQGEKPKPIRPKTNLQMEKGSFRGETTSNREFQNWGYEKPSPIKPHSSIRQEGTMDFTTTNSTQFEGKTTDRPSQIRPTTSTKVTGDFDGTTTNQMMFQNNAIETVKGIRPSTHIQLEEGKFEDQTTARREYQQWELSKTDPIKPSGTLNQEGTMDFTTSNQREFGAKPMTKTEAIRPRTTSPITGEFDSTTTNRMMYQAQPINKVQDIRPRDNLRVQSGEFNGETTTSREYIYKEGTKPESIRPQPNLSQEGNFDFVTSNQVQYEEKTIDRVSKIRPKTHTKASDGKFYGTTTNQAMFQTPAMETVHSVRPSTNLRAEEGTFQGSTTATDAYQQWKTERPKAFQLLSSLKQEGDMNFETTNKSEFREKSFERVQKIRPKTSSKIEGDFEGTTTNQAMFNQPDKIDRVKPIRQQNNLYLEQGKFSDETTTSREYKQWVKNGNKIAVPKKKMQAVQAAGISTQREKPNRRKEISKMQGKDPKLNSLDNDNWKSQETHLSGGGKPDTMDGGDEIQNDIKTETLVDQEDNNVSTISKEEENASNKIEQAMAQQQDESNEPTGIEKDQESKDISTMKADYGTKQLNKVDIVSAPKDHLAHKGKMNFTTTSKTDYPEKTESSDIKHSDDHQENGIALRKKEVTGDTNYESWKLAQNEEPSRTDSSRAVESMSMKQQQTSERKQQRVQNMKGPKSYKPPDNLKLDHVPFEATSTTRTEYKKWEGRRSSAKKRKGNLKQEGKMQFDTTSNDYSVLKDYPLSMEATRPKIKDELKKGTLTPTGNMEFSTTSKSSYAGVSTVRAKNLRPRSSLRLGVSDTSKQEIMSSSRSNPEISSSHNLYELTSTTRASYVGHTGTRTRANRPSTSQKVGEGAFDGQSTTRSTFTMPQESISVVKSRAVKPENHNILQTENGSTGATTYSKSFETKVGHCPVIDLDSGKLPLTLKEERNGHLYYAPRVQG